MYTHIHGKAMNSKFPNHEILGAQYLTINSCAALNAHDKPWPLFHV